MIYFDNAATTKPSETALKKAEVFNYDLFYNPSTLYQGGLNCAKEIKEAKASILSNLGAVNCDVVFTSCGSESDNMAVFCATKRGIFVTDKGEHSAIYKSFLELKNRGQTVYFAGLNKDGSVNTDELIEFVKNNKDVSFVSIVHVNNETGAVNDVNYIAKEIKNINKRIIFHVDGVQAYGKLIYRLSNDIDLYSISSHKINGLKGTGALIKRKNVNLSPLIFGGGQENGLRSGTENVFGIKMLEFAGTEKYINLRDNYDYVLSLKKYFKNNLDKNLFTIIGGDNSSPYILCVSAKGLRGEVVMHSLETQGIIVGNGSACSSKNRFSRVLESAGYDRNTLDGVIRISFSVYNTMEECISAVKIINKTVEQLKGKLN